MVHVPESGGNAVPAGWTRSGTGRTRGGNIYSSCSACEIVRAGVLAGVFNAGEQHLSNDMAKAWKSFAICGNPEVDGWTEYMYSNMKTSGGSSNNHDHGANFNFTYVYSPKAIGDGQEWCIAERAPLLAFQQ